MRNEKDLQRLLKTRAHRDVRPPATKTGCFLDGLSPFSFGNVTLHPADALQVFNDLKSVVTSCCSAAFKAALFGLQKKSRFNDKNYF